MKDLFLLDPSVVYLNHGSFGACPRPVFDTYQALQLDLERQPIEFLALDRGFPALLDVARRELAAYVGAPPDDLVFATNTSSALNTVIRSLPLGPGDEVLLGDAEYGGLEILWRFVAEQTGVKLRRAPFAELEPTPNTRVVFCSHIEWSTGRVNDVAAVCSAARAVGALSIVDGAHAPGQVPLDLVALGPDVYAGNCHKWLCAPKGSAFLYARPGAQESIEPLVVSWDWIDGAPFHQRHRWQGTRDPAALLAVPAAIAFQAEHDWPSVRRALSRAARPVPRRLRARAAHRRVRPDARIPPTGRRRRRPQAGAVRAAPHRGAGRRDEGWLGNARLDPGLQRRP